MLEIKESFENILEIKKSRFIAVLRPLYHQSDLINIIDELKEKYPKANHYCHAYLIGDNANNGGYDDDGEPNRTAGLPILNALQNFGITNVVCVVIRYFGGIKLGAGGLIRAYQNAAKEVLDISEVYKRNKVKTYRIVFSYEHQTFVDKTLSELNIIDRNYDEKITYTLIIENDEELDILNQLEYIADLIEFVEDTNIFLKL